MRTFLLLITLLPCACLAYPSAHYIGIGTGYTWTQAQFNDKIRTLGAFREVPSYSDVDSNESPWHIFLGFRFHPNYGIEIGYLDYGSIVFQKTLTTYDDSTASISASSIREADISSQGFYLQHVLSYPLFKDLIIQARLGVLIGSTTFEDIETLTTISEDTGSVTITQPNITNDGFLKTQLAVSTLYKYSQNWFFRLQLNQIDIEHTQEQESFSQWFTSVSLEYQL